MEQLLWFWFWTGFRRSLVRPDLWTYLKVLIGSKGSVPDHQNLQQNQLQLREKIRTRDTGDCGVPLSVQQDGCPDVRT